MRSQEMTIVKKNYRIIVENWDRVIVKNQVRITVTNWKRITVENQEDHC